MPKPLRPTKTAHRASSTASRDLASLKAAIDRADDSSQILGVTRSAQPSNGAVVADATTQAKPGSFAEVADVADVAEEDLGARVAATPIPASVNPETMPLPHPDMELDLDPNLELKPGLAPGRAPEPEPGLTPELEPERAPGLKLELEPGPDPEAPPQSNPPASTPASLSPEAADTQQGSRKRVFHPAPNDRETPSRDPLATRPWVEPPSRLGESLPVELREMANLLYEGRSDGDASNCYNALRDRFLDYCRTRAEDMALQLLMARFHVLTNQAAEAATCWTPCARAARNCPTS